ncbi:MAG TPA: N-acetylglucosamine kinase, partial [Chitinophagaceae bacterium]|nr:N-acetylglucosamine kinase [Chitinophagaceae bacterium]
MATLIADCGATKCDWSLLENNKVKKIVTQGFSLYFLSAENVKQLLITELLSKIKNTTVLKVYFY